MADSLEVSLARLEGKVDKIDLKLDSNREFLLDRINAGGRESMQALRLVEQRLAEQESRGQQRDQRLDRLEARAGQGENFQARLIGVAMGVGLVAGAGGVGIAKALGL